MSTIAMILLPLSVIAVAVVLVLGVLNMAKGGSPERSQKLMQARVLFQFGAIVIVMFILYLSQH